MFELPFFGSLGIHILDSDLVIVHDTQVSDRQAPRSCVSQSIQVDWFELFFFFEKKTLVLLLIRT